MDRDTEVKMLAMQYASAKFVSAQRTNPEMIFGSNSLAPLHIRELDFLQDSYICAVKYYSTFETMNCDEYLGEIG